MRPTRLAAAVVCVIGCAIPVAVGAQSPDGAVIPRELLLGLFDPLGRSPMQVFIGELPSGFPKELIPEHSRVVGGLIGYSTIGVFEVSDPVGAASAVERQARAAGWTALAHRPDGFVPADPFPMNSPLCHNGRSLSVIPMQTRGGDLLRVEVSDLPTCNQELGSSEDRATPMPVFRLPVGASMWGSGASMGGGYEFRSATIRAGYAADELAEFFSDQAGRAGWSPTPVTRTPDLGVWAFQRKGADEVGLVALLTVFRLREGEYFAQFLAESSWGSFTISLEPSSGSDLPR